MEVVYERMVEMEKWLQKNHPEVFEEQKHLEAGSVEKAYWHYGYLVALKDVMRKQAQ